MGVVGFRSMIGPRPYPMLYDPLGVCYGDGGHPFDLLPYNNLHPTFGSLAQFRSGVWRNSVREFVCKINDSLCILLHSLCIIIIFFFHLLTAMRHTLNHEQQVFPISLVILLPTILYKSCSVIIALDFPTKITKITNPAKDWSILLLRIWQISSSMAGFYWLEP